MAESTVVVVGDATIDWMMVPVDARPVDTLYRDDNVNWRQYAGAHSCVTPGGALLLAEMVKRCLTHAGVKAGVVAATLPTNLREVSPDDVIHSTTGLAYVAPDKRLRASKHHGFHGPEKGVLRPLPLATNPERARVVVLDDAGNGFRNRRDAWPRALEDESALMLLKMSRPVAEGELWKRLTAAPAPGAPTPTLRDRLVVVLRADELRRLPGVRISRSLSWERTSKDFLFHMRRSAELEPLHRCAHLVVTFDTDGAIWFRPGDQGAAMLLYDPLSPEGGMAATVDGFMVGLTSLFTATLAAALADGGFADLERGIKLGLARQRALIERGYLFTENAVALPYEDIFAQANPGAYRAVTIEPPADLEIADRDFWRILTAKTRFTRAEVARDIVLRGESEALNEVPTGRFGKLRTIDRAEIEAYSAIRELLAEYIDNPKPPRPLCLAVFGPPGSGKSFGVKQVAESVGDQSFATVTFNVSQFRAYGELVSALHRVRDLSLKGKIPFVFFDEFDSPFERPLGWLRYFLAPMQDGEFRDGEATHPIGKAVFVFAGGTRSSYERFVANLPGDETTPAKDVVDAAKDAFREAKGPDFTSRLRGFIDIMGPNRQRNGKSNDEDEAFVIRRAVVLRSMLTDKSNPKIRGLVDNKGRVRIEEGVLRALLFVESYRHGMRSMEAVLDMSRLSGRWHFDASCLPSREQLDMHVGADEFFFLAQQERFLTMLPKGEMPGASGNEAYRASEKALVEAVARGIHQAYVERRKREGASSDTVVPWDALRKDKRLSNLDAASDVPSKLCAIGHGIRRVPDGQKARIPDLSDAEIAKLARMEHERWCRELRIQGYVYGPKLPGKQSPYLVAYDELPADIQQYDVQAIEDLPCILRDAGYEIFRLDEVDDLRDRELVERLARVVHASYADGERAKGSTEESNPSMRPYDQLSDTLKESNRDVARSTVRKLVRVGCRVRNVSAVRAPRLFEVPEDKVEVLAEQEHACWAWERRFDGWTYKPGAKDEKAKTSPYLTPWHEIPDKFKQYDRDNVKLLPKLLAQAGYEVVEAERD